MIPLKRLFFTTILIYGLALATIKGLKDGGHWHNDAVDPKTAAREIALSLTPYFFEDDLERPHFDLRGPGYSLDMFINPRLTVDTNKNSILDQETKYNVNWPFLPKDAEVAVETRTQTQALFYEMIAEFVRRGFVDSNSLPDMDLEYILEAVYPQQQVTPDCNLSRISAEMTMRTKDGVVQSGSDVYVELLCGPDSNTISRYLLTYLSSSVNYDLGSVDARNHTPQLQIVGIDADGKPHVWEFASLYELGEDLPADFERGLMTVFTKLQNGELTELGFRQEIETLVQNFYGLFQLLGLDKGELSPVGPLGIEMTSTR